MAKGNAEKINRKKAHINHGLWQIKLAEKKKNK